MKKKLLLVCLIALSFQVKAQFELKNYDDDSAVIDGQTLFFADTGCDYAASCNWRFKIVNTSDTESINVKISIDDMVNSDGSDVQLCFAGTCLNSISLGASYPSTAAVIQPGASTGPGNYFWNQNPVDTTTPMSWTLRFQAYDGLGLEIGTPISVTYSYEPNLSTENFNLSSVQIFPTQVKNELTVTSKQKLNADFYDILGKKVKQVEVKAGDAQIDVSDLAPQLYIIRFRDLNGNTLVKKIIVE